MSEADAQVAANPSTPRLAELGRAITRGVKSIADATSGPSFAASLASANQAVQGDAPSDGTVAHGGHRAGEAPLGGAEFGPRSQRDRAASASPTGAFEPASAGLTASLPPTSRPPTISAIRPDGRTLGPVPDASTVTQPTMAQTTAPQPAQPYVAAASTSAGQPVSPAYSVASPAPAGPTYATHGPPGPSTSVPAHQPAAPPTASPARPPSSPTTVAPYGSPPPASQVAPGSPAETVVASAPPRTTATAATGFTADARTTPTFVPTSAPDAAPAYPATAATSAPARTASTISESGSPVTVAPYGSLPPTTPAAQTGSVTTTPVVDGTGAGQPLALNQYPVPNRSDRSGVLNWASDTPPTGRDLDRLIAEARHRKAGWVTFVANPDRLDEYGKLADRLTKSGIQPIARVEDPYGDLPPEDVSAIVKELRGHGVRYFQLFDGANVASETPDDRVDVRDYADRWLTAARAVVAGGGLPGVGALAPDGDYDDLGFVRHLLSAVKEKGGTDVLGQAWLALRGEKAGAAATTDDTADLADRASWFDRVSRQALGRSLPILATQDPVGQSQRLTADPASVTPTSQIDQSEQALRRHRRSQPALFAASRGTFAPA